MHYLKSGLIAFRWDKACLRSSPDSSLSCVSGSGLRDYKQMFFAVLANMQLIAYSSDIGVKIEINLSH